MGGKTEAQRGAAVVRGCRQRAGSVGSPEGTEGAVSGSAVCGGMVFWELSPRKCVSHPSFVLSVYDVHDTELLCNSVPGAHVSLGALRNGAMANGGIWSWERQSQ